jgi:menaquinone-dependent protoporphyrinogen oxidase
MKPIAVFYATRDGQTRQIAEHTANRLQSRGLTVDLRNIRLGPDPGDLTRYSAIVLAASVHGGRHEREMVRFVKAHRAQLDLMPTWFFSVTLSQAGAQRAGDPPEKHKQFVADVERMTTRFCKETSWRPKRIIPVAGALLYSRYNFVVRFIMKRMAAAAGAGTDTSHDYEYTDWAALDRTADEITNEIRPSADPPAQTSAA